MSFFSKQIGKRIAAYQRELIETHYREVENMYRQIRGWRHDYRNHIQMMKVLAANGDMDALKVYLDELDTDLNTVDTVVKNRQPHGRRHSQQQNFPCAFPEHPDAGGRPHPGEAENVGAGLVLHHRQPV